MSPPVPPMLRGSGSSGGKSDPWPPEDRKDVAVGSGPIGLMLDKLCKVGNPPLEDRGGGKPPLDDEANGLKEE